MPGAPGALAALAALSWLSRSYVRDARCIVGRARAGERARIARRYGDDLVLAALRENDVGFARALVDGLEELGQERGLSDALSVALRDYGDAALDVLEVLVSSGRPSFGVRACERSGRHLLWWAASCGCLGAVRMLIAHGAPVNHRGVDNDSIPFCAASAAVLGEHEECLREVLLHGADPDVDVAFLPFGTEVSTRSTLLTACICMDMPAAVSFLLRAIASRRPRDPFYLDTALWNAAGACRSAVIPDMLFNAGARFRCLEKQTPVFRAAARGRERVARYLLHRRGGEILNEEPDYSLWWSYISDPALNRAHSDRRALCYLRLLLRLGIPLTGTRYESAAWLIARSYDSADIAKLLLRFTPFAEPDTPASGALADQLGLAVEYGEAACIKALLDHGALRGEKVIAGPVSLVSAMCTDDRKVYEALAAGGARLNYRTDHDPRDWGFVGDYMHHVSDLAKSMTGPLRFDLFKDVMRSGNVNVMRCDSSGNKVLHLAADRGLLEHTDFLLEEVKADVNVRNDCGATALLHAVGRDNVEIVSRLVQVPDLDLTACLQNVLKLTLVRDSPSDEFRLYLLPGTDAFLLASILWMWDILELLLQKGADVHSVDDRGRNALWLALHRMALQRRLPGGPVDPLLELGVSIECADAVTGVRSTQMAAKGGRFDAIRLLCLNGADVNARDHDGNTTLHWAVTGLRFSEYFVLELVRDLGADVDAQNVEGETALHIAARHGAVEEAEALIGAGADVNVADARGRTPLMMACVFRGRRHEFRERWDGVAGEWRQERPSPLSVVHALLEAGADVSRASSRGLQALHFAAASGQADVCRLLASLARGGARLNAPSGSGLTPLHFACRRGQAAVAELLLAAGAAPDRRDGRGRTPLHDAAAKGHARCVSALLEAGADAGLRCAAQLLPLDVAKRSGRASVAAALAQRAGGAVREGGEACAAGGAWSGSAPGSACGELVGGDALLAGLSF